MAFKFLSIATSEMTFILPASLAQDVQQAVDVGSFSSPSELASVAISRELKRLHEVEIARAMQEAVNDPLFMSDLEGSMRDMAQLDVDANRFLAPVENGNTLGESR